MPVKRACGNASPSQPCGLTPLMPAWLQSDECLEKTVQTMQLLGCHAGAAFIVLTGACMRDKAFQLLRLR